MPGLYGKKIYVQGSPRVITKTSHLASLWNGVWGELGNGLLLLRTRPFRASLSAGLLAYQLSDRSTLASSKTSLHYLRSHSGNEHPLDFYSQSLAFSCFCSQSCRKNPSRNPGTNPNWRITHFHRRRNLSYSSITLNSATMNQSLGLSSGILGL